MSSYTLITKALDDIQATWETLLQTGQHFLHQPLKEIALRTRERETMPSLSLPYNIAQKAHKSHTYDSSLHQSAAAKDMKDSVTADLLTELSQTPLSKKEAAHPAEKKKAFEPRPAFMRAAEPEMPAYSFTPPKPR